MHAMTTKVIACASVYLIGLAAVMMGYIRLSYRLPITVEWIVDELALMPCNEADDMRKHLASLDHPLLVKGDFYRELKRSRTKFADKVAAARQQAAMKDYEIVKYGG